MIKTSPKAVCELLRELTTLPQCISRTTNCTVRIENANSPRRHDAELPTQPTFVPNAVRLKKTVTPCAGAESWLDYGRMLLVQAKADERPYPYVPSWRSPPRPDGVSIEAASHFRVEELNKMFHNACHRAGNCAVSTDGAIKENLQLTVAMGGYAIFAANALQACCVEVYNRRLLIRR